MTLPHPMRKICKSCRAHVAILAAVGVLLLAALLVVVAAVLFRRAKR